MRLFLRGAQRWLPAPVLFLLVCLLAYGLQISRMGLYLDDWIILNAYNLGGAQRVLEYAFIGNRPLVFWIWVVGFKLFGSSLVLWQVWALFWRWLTVVIFWLSWRALWPKAPRQVALAAVLFAVYPLFRQQASALTFSFHWFCFFLSGLSLYLLILAVRYPSRFLPLMAGSVLAGAVQLFSQEFFVGIELLRPLVIWLALEGVVPGWKARLKRTLFYYGPFLLMMAGYLAWRTKFMPTPGTDRNTPRILYELFTTPLTAISQLAIMFLQDTVETLSGVWYKTFQPELFSLTPLAGLVAWAVVVITFLLTLFYAWPWGEGNGEGQAVHQQQEQPWYATAIPYGLVALLLGFAPGWTIGRHMYDLTGIYNDRFGMASTFGAAILLVAGFDLLLRKRSYQLVLICLLVALGAGQNFRFMTSYRWSWEKQRQLYWQLKWRAPHLQEPTMIMGEGALASYIGSWATTSALIQMYAPEKNVHFVDYWYMDVTKQNPYSSLNEDRQVDLSLNFMHYRADPKNSLAISFEPEKLQCLWVLREQDDKNHYVSDVLKEVLPLSNLDRILREPDAGLRSDIFGDEVPRDWCYYFEKADLARQYGDWGEVVSLWSQAEAIGEAPHVGVEYMPFIEGFAHAGDWKRARELTKAAYFPKYEMREYLCQTWQHIDETVPNTPEKQKAVARFNKDYPCGQ